MQVGRQLIAKTDRSLVLLDPSLVAVSAERVRAVLHTPARQRPWADPLAHALAGAGLDVPGVLAQLAGGRRLAIDRGAQGPDDATQRTIDDHATLPHGGKQFITRNRLPGARRQRPLVECAARWQLAGLDLVLQHGADVTRTALARTGVVGPRFVGSGVGRQGQAGHGGV